MRKLLQCVSVVVVLAFSFVVRAQETPVPVPAPTDSAQPVPSDALPDTVVPVVVAPDSVPVAPDAVEPPKEDKLDTSDKDAFKGEHEVGAYVQTDARFFFDDNDKLADKFELRRVRPSAKGKFGKHFSYKFLVDFASAKLQVLDASFDITLVPELAIRIGKGKPPTGLERLQSGASLVFIERAFPTQLVPNRDIGVQLVGDVGKGLFTYALGVMNGTVDGGQTETNEDGKFDVVARVFGQPFKTLKIPVLSGLSLGASATVGDRKSAGEYTGLASYKSPGQATIFSYSAGDETTPIVASGKHTRGSIQGTLYEGPIGVLAEYVISAQNIQGARKARIDNEAWQIAVNGVLTGESTSYKGITPKHPFSPETGGWGAVELSARYSEIDFDDDAFGEGFADPAKSVSRAREFSGGATWYVTEFYKFQVDFARTNFVGGGGSGDRPSENVVLGRSQIAF